MGVVLVLAGVLVSSDVVYPAEFVSVCVGMVVGVSGISKGYYFNIQ